MLTRRTILGAMAVSPLVLGSACAIAQSLAQDTDIYALEFPDIAPLRPSRLLGNKKPGALERAKATAIINGVPRGQSPISIAQHFIDTYSTSDPRAISQWPKPEAWNPLMVEFFSATDYRANNDMIPWCAAFANWCIGRSGKRGSGSAASQSFLWDKRFTQIKDPAIGDLAVFTCYEISSGKSIGLGHVAFVKAKPEADRVLVVGGNQNSDGRSSIISEKYYSTGNRRITRTVGGKDVPCNMRLNAYVSLGQLA